MSSESNGILRMPLLPLRGLTVFPNMILHFDVGREKSIRALDESVGTGENIFLVTQKDSQNDDPGIGELYTVGTVSRVRQILKLPGESIRVLVEGVCRAEVTKTVETDPFFVVDVAPMDEKKRQRKTKKLEALMREAQSIFEEYSSMAPRMTHEVIINVMAAEEPGYLADYITQNVPIKHQDKQEILEERDSVRRLEKLCAILLRELEIIEIEIDIQTKVRSQVAKNQKEYYLKEQLKAIRSELGDGDYAAEPEDEYTERILELRLAPDAEEKLLKEAARLEHLPLSSPESAVVRTYLDTCLELPWNTTTKETIHVDSAKKRLDADHYGLEKVKERILEFLSVRQLAPDLKGQILCLVGPPGVGKTSVAMSIAHAINRNLARLSLGGVRDEAEIRGHRKTYVGAMPGRIINAVRQAGSKNPLLLLDEIDKLGNDFRGDPAAALLEVLDAEQNATFRDHYIELPFDLSQCMFITTANTTQTIPKPLLDRMEVIELTSYTDEEKLQIAKRHLIAKQLSRHGLRKAQLRLTDDAIREVIACYTRESGVRNLERELASLCRKAAMRIATGRAKSVRVNADNVEEFLGVRKFKPEKMHRVDEVGVACGLAWTSVGGEILEVEVGAMDGSGKMELTGNLGDVMKESARAAVTYIRSRTGELGVNPNFHKETDLHIHFPEGAIPKDGPSAGITMATAMVSALTGAPVKAGIAMTGEITLRGRVLPIGGLKEKTMAAFRNGIRTVILPLENEKDLAEIDPTVKNALQFVLAEHMDTVLKTAIDFKGRPSLPQPAKGGGADMGAETIPAEQSAKRAQLPYPQ